MQKKIVTTVVTELLENYSDLKFFKLNLVIILHYNQCNNN